jgi:polyferredoxin
MTLGGMRRIVQHFSFAVLMYGGRAGISLGPAIPCFGCPYVAGCGGYCYLMGLQGYIGFGLELSALFGAEGLRALGWFLCFVLLVMALGKAWCGWVCPFGLFQDYLAYLRGLLGIRRARLSAGALKKLSWIKYALLAWLCLGPVLISFGIIHPDFYLPFCQICPGKPLLPLLAGNADYLAINRANLVTASLSFVSVFAAGGMLCGMFLRERFFCLFCPLLAIMHLLKPLTFLKLVKAPKLCQGCASCHRACPMDIEGVYMEREFRDVQGQECLDCGKCLTSCPSQGALSFSYLGRTIAAGPGTIPQKARK